MKDFLDEYIVSLSGKRRSKIYDIMSAARVSKEDLEKLAEKLVNTRKEAPIVIRPEKFGALIESSHFEAAYRDVYRRTLELYNASNNISLLLDSHAAVLTSQIKAQEDELVAMEKAIANYAFTLSDNGFYDYAFTETFNDDTMLETDSSIALTDRSEFNFNLTEKASINSSSGILTLSPALQISYPLYGNVLTSNCLGFATSDTGLNNSLNATVDKGWRVALAAPKPISSKLPGADKQGAQIELELILLSPAPCDTIVLTPFSDIEIEILNIQIVNTAEETNTMTILNTATALDRPLTVNFPMQAVTKFKILVNQSIYSRGAVPAVKEQVVYRNFYSNLKQEREKVAAYMGRDYLKNKKALKMVFVNAKKHDKNLHIFKAEIPQTDFDVTHGPLTIDRIISRKSSSHNSEETWSYKSKVGTQMRRMIDQSIFNSNGEILNDRQVYNTGSAFINRLNPLQANFLSGGSVVFPDREGVHAPLSADLLAYPVVEESKYLDYQYNIGLRNIQIGSGLRIFRGVFITKPIPAPSDSGEVKIKVDDVNFSLLDTSRDSNRITSIEYSVSNKSTPKGEEDWIPILPIDSTYVDAERIYFNEAGVAYLRFPASPEETFVVYKNGYRMDLSQITYIKSFDEFSIKGIRVTIGTYTPTDVFTINYVPSGNQTIVNFEDRGAGQSSLATAYDETGAGETFSSTYNNQVVTLQNEPFISYDKVQQSGGYSTTLGFTGAYQPITVVLADGTVALNQTNYLGVSQNNLSAFNETKTAFIHSGKNIVFNKPMTEQFTVYYQYLPSNLRVRIVLRVNDINYVSPIVKSIQIKAKTLKANARKQL
jgi:hypothetical protein